jgi:hypothetical protein
MCDPCGACREFTSILCFLAIFALSLGVGGYVLKAFLIVYATPLTAFLIVYATPLDLNIDSVPELGDDFWIYNWNYSLLFTLAWVGAFILGWILYAIIKHTTLCAARSLLSCACGGLASLCGACLGCDGCFADSDVYDDYEKQQYSRGAHPAQGFHSPPPLFAAPYNYYPSPYGPPSATADMPPTAARVEYDYRPSSERPGEFLAELRPQLAYQPEPARAAMDPGDELQDYAGAYL